MCLKITNHSFRLASPHLWNRLPVSFRQSTNQSPHLHHISVLMAVHVHHHHFYPP